MKPPLPHRPSRVLSILWPVAVCAWVGVAGYWFYLSFLGSLSANEVRAEGEAVTAILEEHKSARGHYPKALEETRAAGQKFPRGLAVGYTPTETLRGYVLVVSGGGHTWRYHSGAGVWELVPSGGAVGGAD